MLGKRGASERVAVSLFIGAIMLTLTGCDPVHEAEAGPIAVSLTVEGTYSFSICSDVTVTDIVIEQRGQSTGGKWTVLRNSEGRAAIRSNSVFELSDELPGLNDSGGEDLIEDDLGSEVSLFILYDRDDDALNSWRSSVNMGVLAEASPSWVQTDGAVTDAPCDNDLG